MKTIKQFEKKLNVPYSSTFRFKGFTDLSGEKSIKKTTTKKKHTHKGKEITCISLFFSTILFGGILLEEGS